MATLKILDNVSDKLNVPISDWNNCLNAIWASDVQPPSIYSTEQSRHYWDERNGGTSVRERSR